MDSDLDTLWRVAFYGHDAMPASMGYFYENLDRRPIGQCIIQIVEIGHVEIRSADGNRHRAHVGEAFLFRYGEDTTYGFPANNTLPYRSTWISLEGAGLPDHWDLLRRVIGSPIIPVSDDLRVAMTRLAALAEPQARCDPTTMATAVYAFVMQLVTSGRERVRSHQPPVERAIDDLLANPAAPWSLKEVAERHSVSREHLTRAFQQRMGQPPAAWLNHARIVKARHLLSQTDLSMSAIAIQAGFSSTHTLARQIKDTTGLSPQNYRESRRTTT